MPFLLDRAYHFHWVTPDVARSAQPYLGFYRAFLKTHAIRAIVNLRGYNPRHRWWHREKAVAAFLNIAHTDIKLASRKIPQQSLLVDLIEALERSPRPLLLKCSGGQDRTSFAAALLLLQDRGWNAMPEAEAQFFFWPYLHWPSREQVWLKMFPRYAMEDAKGQPIGAWLKSSYDPSKFAAWLKSKGLPHAYREIQREGAGKSR